MLKKTIITFTGLIALGGHTSVHAINWSSTFFKIYTAGGSNNYFYNYGKVNNAGVARNSLPKNFTVTEITGTRKQRERVIFIYKKFVNINNIQSDQLISEEDPAKTAAYCYAHPNRFPFLNYTVEKHVKDTFDLKKEFTFKNKFTKKRKPEEVEMEVNGSFGKKHVIEHVDFTASPIHSSPVFNTIQPTEKDDIFYTPPQSLTKSLRTSKAPSTAKKQTFRGSPAGNDAYLKRKNNQRKNFLTSARIQ